MQNLAVELPQTFESAPQLDEIPSPKDDRPLDLQLNFAADFLEADRASFTLFHNPRAWLAMLLVSVPFYSGLAYVLFRLLHR